MISVDGLVQLDSPGLVTNLASGITTALGAVTTQATAVQSTWSGLAGSYDAPEEHLVLTAMDEPVSVAEDLEAKGETVRTALEAYAETLEELHQRKNTLIADIGAFYEKKAQTEAENADNSVWEDVKDAFNDEDVKLMQAEEALSDRAAQLQYDKEAAERACANAIGDVWGAEHYEAAGESWVSDTTVYGATVEGYQDAVRSGQAAWGHPSMWSEGDWTTKVAQVFDGAGQSLAGTFGFFGDLVGVDGGGQAKAAWSGLGQLAMDVNNMTGVGAVGWFFNPEANQESAGRLWEMGKGIIGIGTWGTSGWQTGGGLGLDVALGVASGGTAFAVKGGLKGAAKGAAAASKVPGSSLSAGALTNGLRNAVKGGLDGSVKGLNTWWETSKGNLRGLMPQLAPAGGTPGGRHQFDVTMPDKDTGRTHRETAPGERSDGSDDGAPAKPTSAGPRAHSDETTQDAPATGNTDDSTGSSEGGRAVTDGSVRSGVAARPQPDVFDAGAADRYSSGDAHRPGEHPPHTPVPTFINGQTEAGWASVNRGPDKPWMSYQEQITGIERAPDGHIPEYMQVNPDTSKPVAFDGHTFRGDPPQEVFLDSKRGYQVLAFAPGSRISEKIGLALADEAQRQLDALPDGARLEWHVSDPNAAVAVRHRLAQEDIYEVDVIYTPEV